MSKPSSNFGKLESVHGIAPAFMQRAVIVAALSFVFFLAMLVAFYMRQKLGYFLLSSGFLVIYILTMFGWLMLRKNVLKIYENGLVYRKFAARWSEIETFETKTKGARITCEIRKTNGEKTTLTDALQGIEQVAAEINAKIAR